MKARYIIGGSVGVVWGIATVVVLWSSWSLIGGVLLGASLIGVTVWGCIEAYDRVTYIQLQKERHMYELRNRLRGQGFQDTCVVQSIASTVRPLAIGDGHAAQPKAIDYSGVSDEIPSFYQQLSGRRENKDYPITLAYARVEGHSSKPIESPELQSTGIIGHPGGGKTVTTFHLLTQAIIKTQGKVRFIVVDPHMNGGTGQSLVERMGPYRRFLMSQQDVQTTVAPEDMQYQSLFRTSAVNPSIGGQDMLTWCRIVRAEVARRKDGKTGPSWVFVIDEFSAVMRDASVRKAVNEMLQDITQESRKFSIFAIVIGQDFRANAIGGTDIRNTLPLWLVHKANEAWASAILPSRLSRLAPSLRKGEVVVLGVDDFDGVAVVPMVSEQERYDVADMFYTPEYHVTEIEGDIHDKPTQSLILPGTVDSVVVPTQASPMVNPYDYDEYTLVMDALGQGLEPKEAAQQVYGKLSQPELVLKRKLVMEMIAWGLKR